MTGPPRLTRLQRMLLSLAVRREDRDWVEGDLEDGYRDRTERLGEPAARRHLRRELLSLLLWRLRWWRGAAVTREAAGATTMRSTALGRDFLQDLRFGARTLLRRPGFTLTAVTVLALGIGAPTTVLTLVNGIFRPPPSQIREPDRLVRLTRGFGDGRGGGALANPDYLYYRENASTLSGLAAYGDSRAVSYTTDGEHHDQLQLLFVSENFFDVLGVSPSPGRAFLPSEGKTPGTHPVVVVSHGFWVRALGRDPNVVGRSIELAGAPFDIVGVAPEGFGPVSPVEPAPDAWTPIAMYGSVTRATDSAWWERLPEMRDRWLQGVGRLAPGVTFQAAEANLMALGEALDYEGKSDGEGAFLQRQFLYGPGLEATLNTLSRMLLVVVGLVLLVAAFNVAVLLLSRATTRLREMGIRSALGAGQGRITRQLLVETLLLAGTGGLLGVVLAFVLSDLAGSLLPVQFAAEFRPDARVVSVAAGLTLATALAVGLFPALLSNRRALRAAIQGRVRAYGTSRGRIQNALVVGQVSLSVMLVAGALLFGRSFWKAHTQELGFATENRLVVQVNLRELDYEAADGRAFVQEALRRIETLPGVLGAAVTRQIPFQGDWTTEFDAPPGATPNYEGDLIFTGLNAVSPSYFQVAGVPIVDGRALAAEDVEGSTPVVVVNEALAQAIWPGERAVGKTLPVSDDLTVEVAGVARTAEYYELGEDPAPQVYLSVNQFYQPRVHFLVHTSADAASLAPLVQSTLREIDPRLVFGWVTTMASVFEDETARYQVSAILVSVFSTIALLLAAAGLYGTISFLVARRTREIGVRMALGADRGRVAGQIMRSGLRLALVGVGLGLAGTLVLRRFTENLLFGIRPSDPWPVAGAALILLAVAAGATFGPARHATRVDPMEAIRTE